MKESGSEKLSFFTSFLLDVYICMFISVHQSCLSNIEEFLNVKIHASQCTHINVQCSKRVQKGKPFLTASTLLKEDTKRITDTGECVTVHLGCQHIQMYVINSGNDNCLRKRFLSILLSENSLGVVT